MLKTSPRLLPYEPGYTGHWQAERRRRETREWLRRREMEVAAKRRREAAPSIVPEQPDSAQNQPTASNMRQSKDAVVPTLQLRHAEGEGWCVAARWPDGHVEDIAGFKSEFEANEWIAKDFQTWLETRRNGDQAKLS